MEHALSLILVLLVMRAAGVAGQGGEVELQHRVLLLTTTAYRAWATSYLEKIMLGMQDLARTPRRFEARPGGPALAPPGRPPTRSPSPAAAGLGAPLEVVAVDAPGAAPPDLGPLLWDGAAARFSAVVMHPDLEARGGLTRRQLEALRDFQSQTGARALKFGAQPAALGLAPLPCTQDAGVLAFTAGAPFGISGVRPDARLDAAGFER
jgi:hypothetical protein